MWLPLITIIAWCYRGTFLSPFGPGSQHLRKKRNVQEPIQPKGKNWSTVAGVPELFCRITGHLFQSIRAEVVRQRRNIPSGGGEKYFSHLWLSERKTFTLLLRISCCLTITWRNLKAKTRILNSFFRHLRKCGFSTTKYGLSKERNFDGERHHPGRPLAEVKRPRGRWTIYFLKWECSLTKED